MITLFLFWSVGIDASFFQQLKVGNLPCPVHRLYRDIGLVLILAHVNVAPVAHRACGGPPGVEETAQGMIVQGMVSQGAEIDCYNDHRIAMSFAVAGLAQEDITIKEPECVKKSFPDFWEKLESLG